MKYLIPDDLYDALKWAVLIVLPAFATFFGVVGGAWGVDPGLIASVTTTITAFSTFCGAALGVSAATAKPDPGEGEVGGEAEGGDAE